MIPDLQASFLCEDVRVEASGAHTIVGIVNFLGAPTLPVRLLKVCVWTRWCSGSGTFRQHTRIVAPDETTIVAEADTTFSLENEETHATNVNFFGGIEFTEEGTHHVEILIDDILKLRYPVRVLLPPPAPPMG